MREQVIAKAGFLSIFEKA